jgi:proteasome lid subunit RPN8/RPN11
MYEPVTLAFATAALERKFARLVSNARGEEIGGLLFWDLGRINDLHYKTHKRLFGRGAIGIITHWIVCPNVSNLRDRRYQVSDLEQLIGIAEQTERSLGCLALHFHSHPKGSIEPSQPDLQFWKTHWSKYGSGDGVVVAATDTRTCGLDMACYAVSLSGNTYRRGHFLEWSYIRSVFRKDAKRTGR